MTDEFYDEHYDDDYEYDDTKIDHVIVEDPDGTKRNFAINRANRVSAQLSAQQMYHLRMLWGDWGEETVASTLRRCIDETYRRHRLTGGHDG